MTPAERAKWCIEQAEEIEATLPPLEEDSPKPLSYFCAKWYRDCAFKLTDTGVGTIQ